HGCSNGAITLLFTVSYSLSAGLVPVSRPVFADLPGHDPGLTISALITFPELRPMETRLGATHQDCRSKGSPACLRNCPHRERGPNSHQRLRSGAGLHSAGTTGWCWPKDM